MSLTDRQLVALKSKSKAYKISDGGGLHIYVSTAGGKLGSSGFFGDERIRKASQSITYSLDCSYPWDRWSVCRVRF